MKWIQKKQKNRGFTILEANRVHEREPKLVTVITPVYNAERYLRKTIDSVLKQSLGKDKIDYILVDDGSTDRSRELLLEYSTDHDNIISVFLNKNSGTPGYPRNIAIGLAKSKYITFLDADDWLEPTGLETLAGILEETGDDYVVGKTIKVKENGMSVIAEHESCKDRRSVCPFSIPHMLHHLGPRARMMKTELVKQHEIQFPEMKFAEDKQFFIEVLLHSQTISTTTKPIYYLNRFDNEKTRLTNQTNIMQKTNCNLKVIHYFLTKNLPAHKKKMILNRLYEYDAITRLFTTPHFKKTRLKPVYYYKLGQVLKTTKQLDYEFSEEFLQPLNKQVIQLFREKKYRQLEKLYAWEGNEKIKEVRIIDNLPYKVFSEANLLIRLALFVMVKEDSFREQSYCLQIDVFGDGLESVNDVLIRDTKNGLNEVILPLEITNGSGVVEIPLESLSNLPPSTYSIFIRYQDYLKTNIRRTIAKANRCSDGKREYVFFRTTYGNIGLKIN
ncbi:glycosyltransferase family 2 protein [Bacillus rubiinfantis]|uniref:glycosyltransferase family 2 protein n=1 Tax=Bacillus rubiinfantis TaxID=1499680 RepID=UPI0005AAA068|nr:glycosyltransferase family 2 protein [Bacillus rubiinfantis]